MGKKKNHKRRDRPRPDRLLKLTREVELFLNAGRLASACEGLESMLDIDNGNPVFWHQMGAVRYQLGDLDQAEAAFKRAIELDHLNANYINDLAGIYLNSSRFEAAEGLYKQVLELAPDYIEVQYNLAACYLQQEKYLLAIPVLQRLVAAQPEFAEAQFNLGLALRRIGKTADGLKRIIKASSSLPENSMVTLELARAYKDSGEISKALDVYRQLSATKMTVGVTEEYAEVLYLNGLQQEAVIVLEKCINDEPGQASTLKLLLADIYVNLGRIEDARIILESLTQNVNTVSFTGAANLAVRIAHINNENDPLLQRLRDKRTMLAQDTQELATIDFSLGKVYDDLGQYQRATFHYGAANEFKKRTVNYDRDKIEGLVSDTISVFNADWCSQLSEAGCPSSRPVLIVGLPRSGTSLLEQILATHNDIFGAGELGYFPAAANVVQTRFKLAARYPGCIKELNQEQRADLASSYLELLTTHNVGAARVVDKLPENVFYLGFVRSLLPNASFILIERDPRDVALSIYFQNFQRANDYCWSLDDIAHYCVQYEKIVAHWRTIKLSGLICIKYQQLIEDAESTIKEVLATLELPWSEQCLSFHTKPRDVRTASNWQVRQPLFGTSLDRWKNYPELVNSFEVSLIEQRSRFQ